MTQEQINAKVQEPKKMMEKNKMVAKSKIKAEEDKDMLIGVDLKKQKVIEVKDAEGEVIGSENKIVGALPKTVSASEELVAEEAIEESLKAKQENYVITGSGEDVEKVEVDKKIPRLTNDNLPVIQPFDKKAVLCVRDKYALIMMPIYNAENLVVENCKLYLEDLETKRLYIGALGEVKIDKSKIISGNDHSVMRVMQKFAVNFTEDDMKLAFERAKLFLENTKSMLAISSSLTIEDAYKYVVEYAIEMAQQEVMSKVMENDIRCIHNKKENTVAIRVSYIQTILDEVGAGFTKSIFCKKLCMLEAHYGVKLLVCNKGRYSINVAGNRRYYKFCIVDSFDEGGIA